jgi:hypothetical protein
MSTDKQEREETVVSQVDLLSQTAAVRGYDVAPGSVFIDDRIRGTHLDRPALERLRNLAAEGAFDILLVTAPDRLAHRYAYQVVWIEEFLRCGCEVVLQAGRERTSLPCTKKLMTTMDFINFKGIAKGVWASPLDPMESGKCLCLSLVRGRCGELDAYLISAQFLAMGGRVNPVQAGRVFAQDFPLVSQAQINPALFK